MPANIAHMLICHKAIKKLKSIDPKGFETVAFIQSEVPEGEFKSYANLGSVGPDLFYYTRPIKTAMSVFLDSYVNAIGVEPWSYHLHSCGPKNFVRSMFKVVKNDRNATGLLEYEDKAKLSFIAGFLTHMAADQIIHPLVNGISGPYYRDGDNRKIHRTCETLQDYYLYNEVYLNEEKYGDEYLFTKMDFNKWADCVKGITTTNSRDWFRFFIQRSFAETYYVFPDEKIIEDCVDVLLLFLRECNKTSVYNQAITDYEDKNNTYDKYFKKENYLKYYRVAVELSTIYLSVWAQITQAIIDRNNDLFEAKIGLFDKYISDADLSDSGDLCDVYNNVYEKLNDGDKANHPPFQEILNFTDKEAVEIK